MSIRNYSDTTITRRGALVGLAAGGLGLAGRPSVAQTTDATKYPRMTLRYAHAFPTGWIQTDIDKWWGEEIQKRSGGRIRIQALWAGSGGSAGEILDLLRRDALDFGSVPPAFLPNDLPLVGAGNALPATFKTNDAAFKFINELVATVPAVQVELKRNNVWPLFFHTINEYTPLCTRPAATLRDMQGLRIRTFGNYQPVLFSSFGAVGTNVVPAELYEGLQRGRLDCAYYSYDFHESNRIYEVAKYMMDVDFGPNPSWPIFVNHRKWFNEFSPEVRQLIEQVSREAAERSLRELATGRVRGLEALKNRGVTVVEFREKEELRAKIPNFRQIWLQDMKNRGLGTQAEAVLAVWARYDAT